MKIELPKNMEFYFNAPIKKPISFEFLELFSENDMDSVRIINDISKNINDNFYYVYLNNQVVLGTALNIKKWSLWEKARFNLYRKKRLEVILSDNKFFYGTLVDLKSYGGMPPKEVLNWINGIFIITDAGLDEIFKEVNRWFRKDKKPIIPYDHELIMKFLINNDKSGIFRYFPKDNGNVESLVYIGNESEYPSSALSRVKGIKNHKV